MTATWVRLTYFPAIFARPPISQCGEHGGWRRLGREPKIGAKTLRAALAQGIIERSGEHCDLTFDLFRLLDSSRHDDLGDLWLE